MYEGCGSVVVSTSAWHVSRVRIPDQACFIIRCKNLALNIRDCLSLCLLEETLKAVGPFYLVPMPGEVKYPTQGINRQIPCRGPRAPLSTTPVLAQRCAVWSTHN